MTTPTIVITVEGGVVQDISVSHQVNLVILDRDTCGFEQEELTMVDGEWARVNLEGVPCLPSPLALEWIDNVLLDIKRDQRP